MMFSCLSSVYWQYFKCILILNVHIHDVLIHFHIIHHSSGNFKFRCISSVHPFIKYSLNDVQIYLLCSLVIFSMPLLWPSLPAHRIYTLSIPILLPIAHMGLTGYKLTFTCIAFSNTVMSLFTDTPSFCVSGPRSIYFPFPIPSYIAF